MMMRFMAVIGYRDAAFEQRELGDVGSRHQGFCSRNFRGKGNGDSVRNASGAQPLSRTNAVAAAKNDAPCVALFQQRASTTFALGPSGDRIPAVDRNRRNSNNRVRLLPGVLDDVRDLSRVIGGGRRRRQKRKRERERPHKRNEPRPHHFTCMPA